MKCQHCGSTDIVAIQGQNYCLNCGYAVNPGDSAVAAPPIAPSAPLPPTSPALLSEKPVKLPKKRPAATRPASKGVSKPAAVSKTVTKPAPRPVASSANVGQAPSPTAAALTARSSHKAFGLHRRPSNDIPARRVHPLRFSFSVAITLGVLVGGLVSLALWLQLDSDITAYVAVAGVVTVGIISSLAQSALMYGISRVQDGRPAPHVYWWAAARSGFMDVLNLNVSALIGVAVIGVVGVAAWHFSATAIGLSETTRLVIFTVINLVLAWALLGVYVARRIALPAIIVGGVTAGESLRVGWRLYLHSGGHLVITGLEAVLGRLLAIIVLVTAVYGAAYKLASPSQLEVVIGSGVVVALAVFLLTMVLLEWEARVWLRQYRHLVTMFAPAERVRLLTGRIQART